MLWPINLKSLAIKLLLSILIFVNLKNESVSNMDEIERQRQEQMDMRAQAREDDEQIQQFLDVIRQIESSGGKDTDHQVMESGIHAGQAAIGQYGLMPQTIQEIAKRFGNAKLAAMSPKEIPNTLKSSPELENDLAEKLAKRVLAKQGDPEKAAYSWNMGHNLSPDEIDKREYQKHPYVEKFRRLRDMMRVRKIAGL